MTHAEWIRFAWDFVIMAGVMLLASVIVGGVAGLLDALARRR